jgi:MFS family permease
MDNSKERCFARREIDLQRHVARLTETYHEYPKPFWALVGVTFIDKLGGFLLFPFFSLYITRRFGVGMTEVGVLFALFSVSSFVGSMLGGALTDRLGRKGIIIFSLIASSLSSVLLGLVNSLEVFYLIAVLSGIVTDTGGPARQAMVADMLPERQRAQGYGILRVAFNLSATIGPAIGGLLASQSYLALFLSDAVISLITAGLIWRVLPETRPQIETGAKVETMGSSFRGYITVLRDTVFMMFLGACILMGFTYMNLGATLGVYLRDVQGVPESGYGLLLSLNAIMVVFLQFPITRRIEPYPPMLIMALGAGLYAVGFGLYGFVATMPFFVLAIVILTVGEMLVSPVSQALTARMAPEHMRGRYMAVFGFSFGIPFGIGPILAGLILDNADPHLLWYATGVVGGLAALAFVALHRRTPAEASPNVQSA